MFPATSPEMKIALAIDRFHPGKGGAERSLEAILRALQDRQHELVLVASDWGPAPGLHLETYLVRVPRYPRWRRDLLFARRSAEALERIAPDLVLGVRHTLRADVVLARDGVHREVLEGKLRAAASPFRRFLYWGLPKQHVLLELERRLFMRAKPPLVVASSNWVRTHFRYHFSLDPARVAVVPTGADLSRYRPAAAAQRENLRLRFGAAGKTVALFAGHDFRRKGLGSLLAAWRRLDPDAFQLWVAGSGKPLRSNRLPNVSYLGGRTDVRALLQAADVLVHPTWYDPFSRIVVEALASGVPVITTRFDGARELIADGREGFVVADPGDEVALAERIARFREPLFARAAAQSARRRAERFPESAFVEATIRHIEAEANRLHAAKDAVRAASPGA